MLVLQVVNPAHLEMVELEAVGEEQRELSPLKSGPLLQNRFNLTGEKKNIYLCILGLTSWITTFTNKT